MLALLKKPLLPAPLKVGYASLLLKLYVDREPAFPMQFLRMTRIWTTVHIKPEVAHTPVNPFENFPELRPTEGFPELIAYLKTHFEESAKVTEHTYSFDMLNSVMLDLMVELVRFGFVGMSVASRGNDHTREYDFEEIRSINVTK